MSYPIKPMLRKSAEIIYTGDPLNQFGDARKHGKVITTQIKVV